MWGVAITASVVQAVIVGLLIRNYVSIGFTRLGKILIALPGTLLAGSVFMSFIYYMWAISGLGVLVSVPVMMTVLNVVAVVMLFVMLRM